MTEATVPQAGPKEAKSLKRWEFIFSVLSALLAIGGTVTLGFLVAKPRPTDYGLEAEGRLISIMQARIDRLQAELQMSRDLAEKISAAPPSTVEAAKLRAQVESLTKQLQLLNDAIGQSPEKALAVPMLRKDLDNLRDSYHHDLDSIQSEISRVYDQNKWFIGLMLTMALGLLGLAVSNFLQLRKS
jgi:hypothetical protein